MRVVPQEAVRTRRPGHPPTRRRICTHPARKLPTRTPELRHQPVFGFTGSNARKRSLPAGARDGCTVGEQRLPGFKRGKSRAGREAEGRGTGCTCMLALAQVQPRTFRAQRMCALAHTVELPRSHTACPRTAPRPLRSALREPEHRGAGTRTTQSALLGPMAAHACACMAKDAGGVHFLARLPGGKCFGGAALQERMGRNWRPRQHRRPGAGQQAAKSFPNLACKVDRQMLSAGSRSEVAGMYSTLLPSPVVIERMASAVSG